MDVVSLRRTYFFPIFPEAQICFSIFGAIFFLFSSALSFYFFSYFRVGGSYFFPIFFRFFSGIGTSDPKIGKK